MAGYRDRGYVKGQTDATALPSPAKLVLVSSTAEEALVFDVR